MSYQPEQYWQQRLSGDFSLAATGHKGFSEYYNRWMYRLRSFHLERALQENNIRVRAKDVLDIGSGTGYFVRYYLARQAASVTGVDITDVSIQRLQRSFPRQAFRKMDISRDDPGFGRSFDIVNVFDVLYHIVTDEGFAHAAHFIASACKTGSWILITDGLKPDLGRAQHVRYRSLELYRSVFERHGLSVKDVRPVFCRMGNTSVSYDAKSIFSRMKARLIDAAAPLDYIRDRISCPMEKASLSLLVCRKQ